MQLTLTTPVQRARLITQFLLFRTQSIKNYWTLRIFTNTLMYYVCVLKNFPSLPLRLGCDNRRCLDIFQHCHYHELEYIFTNQRVTVVIWFVQITARVRFLLTVGHLFTSVRNRHFCTHAFLFFQLFEKYNSLRNTASERFYDLVVTSQIVQVTRCKIYWKQYLFFDAKIWLLNTDNRKRRMYNFSTPVFRT